MAKIKITLEKSVIGSNKRVRATVKSLGLHKTQDSVILEDQPSVLGKVNKLKHLLSVEERAE